MSYTIQIIPADAIFPSVKFRTEIEGVSYILRFDWNTRALRWHMGIFDSDENPIKVGIVLNVNYDLIGRFSDENLPPGKMFLYDTSGENLECGRDDLGSRCVLIYATSV